MSDEISTAMIDAYNTGIEMLVQQLQSKLADRVRREADAGERVSFDQIGPVAVNKLVGQHQDTSYINTPHLRRWVDPFDWTVADLLDTTALLRVLNDPGGTYAENMVAAFLRQQDADIIENALGTAFTGKKGTTQVPFLAANQIAHGGTGFTLAKVRSAMKLLKASNGVEGNPDLTIAWTSFQEDEFMDTTEVKSIDFNNQKVLVSGGMDGVFYGFNYVRLEDWTDQLGTVHEILPKVSTTRTCLAWVKKGLLHNVPKSPSTRADQLPTKNFSWQFFGSATFGSTRMQEELLVQIDVVEA